MQTELYQSTVQTHEVWDVVVRGAWGEFYTRRVMVEPADTTFVTRARVRGAARKAFGKAFLYIKGREQA